MFEIATEMLVGELEYRRGNTKIAFRHLRTAVALDDGLPYDEPWGWTVPVRHALGALLFETGESGNVEEATRVYEEDLQRYPGNVWSLVGLKGCYEFKKIHFPAESSRSLATALLGCDDADAMIHSCFCAGMFRREGEEEDGEEQNSTPGRIFTTNKKRRTCCT